MKPKNIWTALFVLLAVASTVWTMRAQGPAVNETQVPQGSTHDDWPGHYGTSLAWRYSALNQINAANVKNLLPAWIFQTGDYAYGLQSTPIVVGGVVFLSAADDVFALDGRSGTDLWEYKYEPVNGLGVGRNFGVAVSDKKVFLGTHDAHVVALDQKTGREVWKVAVADASSCQCNIQAAPLIAGNDVIVGMGAPRSEVVAIEAKTGRIKWRFYAIPGAGEKELATWEGNSWKNGKANTWTTGSYDPELNLVYWGTGDASPAFYGAKRQGSNLYADSIVALDATTGKLRWYFQEVPHDVWDFDAGWEMVLIDREVRGQMRKLLVQFSKSGFTFVLDRVTGKLVTAYPFVENYNWVKGISETGELLGRNEPQLNQITLICPGNIGGKSWNQTAYSPRTGLSYIPVLEMCNDLDVKSPRDGEGGMGGSFVFNAPPGHATAYSHIDAVDPLTGQRKWTYPYKYELFSSMLATAGDLVFTGDPEGFFFALDARSGERLWSFQTGAGNRGSAITYSVGGRQFIATPTGWTTVGDLTTGIWPEATRWHHGSALIVFALPEQSK